jgi:DNA-binding NarL/FixJ family response regulator
VSSPVRSASSTSRVVIADDNDGIRALLRVLIELDDRMLVVGEARDGREALELVEAQRPDLLLLDLSMPELDGLQVLWEIRERALTPKVLVYSGFTAPNIREAALRAGADDFLTKGAEPREIVDRLARLAA